MAVTPKNVKAKSVVNTPITLYTVPVSTTAIVTGVTLCNTSANNAKVDLYITASAVDYYVLDDAPISTKGTLVLGGTNTKWVLNTGDSLKVVTDGAANTVDVIVSLVEEL